jgi:hypothetical protein
LICYLLLAFLAFFFSFLCVSCCDIKNNLIYKNRHLNFITLRKKYPQAGQTKNTLASVFCIVTCFWRSFWTDGLFCGCPSCV